MILTDEELQKIKDAIELVKVEREQTQQEFLKLKNIVDTSDDEADIEAAKIQISSRYQYMLLLSKNMASMYDAILKHERQLAGPQELPPEEAELIMEANGESLQELTPEEIAEGEAAAGVTIDGTTGTE